MRKVVFWSVSGLLTLILLGSAVLWFRSYGQSEQAVVRLGTASVSVFTTDRGQLGWLVLPEQPTGSPFVFRWRVNAPAGDLTPKLEELCVDHALGFGIDREVNIAGLEAPAVANVLPQVTEASWALRRVVLPFWALLALAGGMLMVWLLTFGVRLFRIERGLCSKCSYDVSESSHFCPKCRRPIPKRTWSGESRPTRRSPSAGRQFAR
jgi:hypothetical protein